MINENLQLRSLHPSLKGLLLVFIFSVLFGYGISLILLTSTSSLTPGGIEENYLGNESNHERGTTMKFKKSSQEMLITLHTHVFTLSILFLICSFLLFFTGISKRLKYFLMVEPIVSLMITFGSLVLMWQGWTFFKYLAVVSGVAMHSIFLLSLFFIIRELYFARVVQES